MLLLCSRYRACRCSAPHRDRRPPQIDAKKSVPQELKPKARKIFVGGLAPDTDEGERAGGAPQRGHVEVEEGGGVC